LQRTHTGTSSGHEIRKSNCAELEQALAASGLQALKSQLHPHFLFNTLHGISALIGIDPDRARALVVKLSSLLRTALEYGNSDLITLDEELKFVEDCLDLEKMCLENRLELRWRISPDTRSVLVPQLILQPLVENAILHSVACCREGGWIEVTSRLAVAVLQIEIRNSVGGKRQDGTGLGLQNTTARLKCLYSNEATFSFDLGTSGVATSTLALPAFSSQKLVPEGAAYFEFGRLMGRELMRVLTVDDEPLSRRALADTLRTRTDIEALDSADDAIEAGELIERNRYDVVLLDIHMPELSGIEFADRLNKRKGPIPSIVFVTAHHQHAVAAFEKHAVDYVLKPFSNPRIHEALDEAIRRTESQRAAHFMKFLPHLEALLSKSAKIAIKTKGRILFIDPADVLVVEAQGNYVSLQRQSGSYLLRESISTIAEKLRPYGFIRIHRSVLVNTSFVEEIQPWSTGEYVLRIKGGKEYTVSRTYKNNLKSIARFWVGTESFV
jgi:two-component system LytT family response regulator